jgi:hypothetical protein
MISGISSSSQTTQAYQTEQNKQAEQNQQAKQVQKNSQNDQQPEDTVVLSKKATESTQAGKTDNDGDSH